MQRPRRPFLALNIHQSYDPAQAANISFPIPQAFAPVGGGVGDSIQGSG